MTLLRSREILPKPPPKKTTPKPHNIEPCTPTQSTEPSPPTQPMSSDRRRSLRLSGLTPSPSPDRRVRRRTSPAADSVASEEPRVSTLSLRSGKKVAMPGINNEAEASREFGGGDKGKGKGKMSDSAEEDSAGARRFSLKEKGKQKLVEEEAPVAEENLNLGGEIEPEQEEVNDSAGNEVPSEANGEEARDILSRLRSRRREQFKEIARVSARRFARFSADGEEEWFDGEPGVAVEPDVENGEPVVEDWPGPFSTAWKIIRDRETRSQRESGLLFGKGKPADVEWVPRGERRCEGSTGLVVPSLLELCLKVVVDNADNLVSLDHVPEALRHWMSRMLCDSRRMNARFLRLLVHGSPMEICLSDCSWLSEEEFTESFQEFDPSCLRVLKLVQCGRCLPDYIMLSILARSAKCLPELTTISVRGACRLSDVGLNSLVCSAPALRSIDLSQCSLLTHSSIETLAKSLGSILKELYLEDCQGIDAMRMLPALKKFEQIEILSVAGIESVCDKFISEFIDSRGPNMKELILTDCVKLTDYSVKVIAGKCPGLCAIDVTNCKLTDSSLGYLANGCRAIQRLKLCRNPFSDKSIAAFLETSGECLEELSLNNVRQVGCQTALSLARRPRNLQRLDLSWCRDLTDNALGLILDNCRSLRSLKLFGCTQITSVCINGHSNPDVKIIGLQMSPVLEHL